MHITQFNTINVTKLLGLYIQNDLKWNAHLTEMTKKAAKRLYFLVQLKGAQVLPDELIRFYLACIQSVSLCDCQVFHFSLQQYLSSTMERIQNWHLESLSVMKYNTKMPLNFQASPPFVKEGQICAGLCKLFTNTVKSFGQPTPSYTL